MPKELPLSELIMWLLFVPVDGPPKYSKSTCSLAMISPAGTKLESRIVHQLGHKRRRHDDCDIDTMSMTVVRSTKIRT